ncbi:MAG: DUF4252 domain-containing protein [Muribaculaceae bacterium]|nr:DUF4252 domain-containing protein [Muribaculaceae bacterium]
MKNIVFTLIFVLFGTFASSADVADMLTKLEGVPGVSSVYITKAMLGMAAGMNVGSDDMDLSQIAGKIDNITVISAEKPKARQAVLGSFPNHVSAAKGYQTLMRANEEGETVTIYSKSLGGGKTEFVVYSVEPKEVNVVGITGSVSPAEINAMVGKK